MQFNSIEFIFCFFPLFLAVYFIFPQRLRNGILVLGSFAFLLIGSRGNLLWIVPLILTTLLTYVIGFAVKEGKHRWLFAASLVFLAGVLTFFKCYRGGKMLPPGMSFYLFQMAAYLIDLHRRKLFVEDSLVRYFTQMTMFPKIMSGPLMMPARLRAQTWGRGYLPEDFCRGFQELILGLGLKVLIADRLGGLWSQAGVIGYQSISVPFAWAALIAYTMRLYFDFYGYSVMAVGIGRMLGFKLPRNFDDPYVSKTVSEFYRRWHVTLGAWFREYLYFPLGGSRKGTGRTIFNLAVVWLFTGLWHGIGWNYLIWAGFLFFLIVNEKLWSGRLLNRSKVISHVYVIFVILLSWLPFAIHNPADLIAYLGRMFGLTGVSLNPNDIIIWGKRYLGLMICGLVLATPFPRNLWNRIKDSAFASVLLFVLFWVIIYFLATRNQDPFVYFQY